MSDGWPQHANNDIWFQVQMNCLQDQITAEFAELQLFLQQQQQAFAQRLRDAAGSAITQLVENMELISDRCDLIEEALEDIQSMRNKAQLLR
eukprot:g28561.t1